MGCQCGCKKGSDQRSGQALQPQDPNHGEVPRQHKTPLTHEHSPHRPPTCSQSPKEGIPFLQGTSVGLSFGRELALQTRSGGER